MACGKDLDMADHIRTAVITLAVIVFVLAATKNCAFVGDLANPYGMNKEYWKMRERGN